MKRNLLLHLALFVCAATSPLAVEPNQNPAETLPAHIKRLTWFGERADWSQDGKRILFVEKTFGDVYEVELATGVIRPMTHHYPHHGYTRALYLANGDLLLSGPERFDPQKPADARVQCFLWVLNPQLGKPAVNLGMKCSEGPAVSRKRLHIAWTQVSAQYPDEMVKGASRILEADITYDQGTPKLGPPHIALESGQLHFKCTLETQNFVPPDEKNLTFSAYGYQGTEVCVLNLATKVVTNLTNSPEEYDEPEGISPDGAFTLVESDRPNKKGWRFIDIWKLPMEGAGYVERLTFFSDFPGFKASNPVMSDDGLFMAFQMARTTDEAGVGYGLFLYDFARAKAAGRRSGPSPE